MSAQEEITVKDRLSFHLAYALQKQKSDDIGDCLTHDELSFLISGKPGKKKRDSMWAHINACSNCYENWIAMPPPTPEKSFVRNTREFFQDLAYWIFDSIQSVFIPKYAIPAFAVAIACFIIVYVHLMSTPEIEQYLNNGYQMVMKTTTPIELDLPWEKNQQKSAIALKNSINQKAFALGQVKGKNRLMKTSAVLFSQQERSFILENDVAQVFFITGQWMILIKSAKIMDNDYPDHFWKEQNNILDELIERIKSFESKKQDLADLSEKLHQLKKLWSSKESKLTMKWKSQLGKINEQIIELYSPRFLSTGE
jgi:hypothetical protein